MIHLIELLYFEGCPAWQTALDTLYQVIAEENLPCEVRLVEIKTPEEAQAERFLGSPSFRMDGADLWPEARTRYNLSCRVYSTPAGLRGSPTPELLLEKVRAQL